MKRFASKGALEAELANSASRFQREQQGKGPIEVRAHILGDLLLIRSTGIFTAIESKLCASEAGRQLILSSRRELRSINHEEIETTLAQLCGCQVLRSHYDVNVEGAEQIEVFVLDQNLEQTFSGR